MGVGSDGVLGAGYCRPEFTMLSLNGRVIIRGTTWQYEIGSVAVPEPHSRRVFCDQARRAIEHSGTLEQYISDAARRWMNTHPKPPQHN